MRRLATGLIFAIALVFWASAAGAFYGTVEYLDGRILNGKIEIIGDLEQVGLFVPDAGAYLMIPLMDIKRIEFNWNYSTGAVQPYYLRNKGDIKIHKISGEVVQGAYFGSANGIRQLKVILDDKRQEPVFLNDNKTSSALCIRSISFETVHVPNSHGTQIVSMKTGKLTPINFQVNVDVAALHETPGGPNKAQVHFGVGLTHLESKGEWTRVRTVGDVEVEGWIRSKWIARAK